MTVEQQEWVRAKKEMVGSPKAMWRMTAYLDKAKPDSIELVVDEMLNRKFFD